MRKRQRLSKGAAAVGTAQSVASTGTNGTVMSPSAATPEVISRKQDLIVVQKEAMAQECRQRQSRRVLCWWKQAKEYCDDLHT